MDYRPPMTVCMLLASRQLSVLVRSHVQSPCAPASTTDVCVREDVAGEKFPRRQDVYVGRQKSEVVLATRSSTNAPIGSPMDSMVSSVLHRNASADLLS